VTKWDIIIGSVLVFVSLDGLKALFRLWRKRPFPPAL
jgi:hypothetical protein